MKVSGFFVCENTWRIGGVHYKAVMNGNLFLLLTWSPFHIPYITLGLYKYHGNAMATVLVTLVVTCR